MDGSAIRNTAAPAEGAQMSRPKPAGLESVKHFAKVSRQVVLRRMAADQCLDARVYWSMVLWSWCGPEKTEDGMVVRKDAKGYMVRDAAGEPIPARQRDIFHLLGLRPELRGHLSRAVARFIEEGSIWTDERGVLYADPDPPAFDREKSDTRTGIKSWVIADKVIRIEDLPETDSDTRTALIRRLDELSTGWKNDLKSLRTRYRMLLVQPDFDGRILIDKKRREVDKNNPSSSAFSTVVEEEAPEESKAEEEQEAGSYETFKKLYPKAHFDEGKAKPAFLNLKPAVRRRCIGRLVFYLGCERWKADGGRWIPLASNWLKSYEADPPPPITPSSPGPGAGTQPTDEQVRQVLQEQEDLRNFLRTRRSHG